ncbi:hypothetical protein G3495_10980 [Shewanella baltica]|uniref:hypothetical protein n=1 Tax=Shewanella baltica TaxID=62322 RepID=UPI00217E4ADC|nr:hypothetical protein [Shewanella baltica]MCS6235644.1 hypothetical protein [Shewanella baltica]MCS6270193.1 hypothetical protein [Shewanella baltica]
MNNTPNYTEASEHDAVPLHSESQIQLLVNDVISVDAGKSFAISIELLVTTMLPHPQEDYLKSYKRAAMMLLIRLNDADRDRFKGFSFACDEGRSIVYFGIKDEFGSLEIS